MSIPLLTVAIPTYNRADRLKAQIERLFPQLRPGVKLRIFDNASTDSTCDVVKSFSSPHIEYIGSKYNGGANWNFARCVGESQSEWVWILSDDDPVSQTAITDLLKLLENHDCDFIHAMPGVYSSEKIITDVPSLLEETKFGRILWISTCIYRTRSFLELMSVFHESTFTWAPQVVVVLRLLESGRGRVLLSSQNLFGPAGQPATWSSLDFLIRVCIIPEFLHQPSNQKLLAEDILSTTLTSSLLNGLKEAQEPSGIQKWRRISRQSTKILTSYYHGGLFAFIIRNWFKSGKRRQSWLLARQMVKLQLLIHCPYFLFRILAKTSREARA